MNSTQDTIHNDGNGRYIIGIDLGTTNCSLCYVDLESSVRSIRQFAIPQLVATGEVGAEPLLPSFCYLPGDHELPPGAIALPWNSSPSYAVGKFAREQGARIPERLVNSAKSWLAHGGVDRNQPILPWGSDLGQQKASPVDISFFYLNHLKEAWNHAYGKLRDHDGTPCRMEEQQVIVTVPASFDEVARELTIKAAKKAGIKHLTLIEEPLAAFYSWLNAHEESWKTLVAPGDVIVVVDVGGGTTDFSLIEIDSDFTLRRKAVGNHLLLGGDNIDMALARKAESAWKTKLTQRQWTMLCQECRRVKETLLDDNAPETATVQLQGRGSSVLAGHKSLVFNREEVKSTILDGFFADIPADFPPPEKRRGIQEMGLPYAADPTVTRHLLQFLRDAGPSLSTPVPMAVPDKVLFNGGAMIPPAIRRHVINVISRWTGKEISELDSPDFSLAVSLGAATYGLARRGQAVRVKGGIANAYFLEIQNQDNAELLCVMPRDTDEGIVCTLEKNFFLQTNTPVAFPLHASATRLGDKLGDMVSPADDITPLPPLRTSLRYGKHDEKTSLKVSLSSRLNEIGTLEVWCQSLESQHKYPLTFELRDAVTETAGPSAAMPSNDTTLEEALCSAAVTIIENTFTADPARLSSLLKDIETALQLPRAQWPAVLLRRFADMMLDHPEWRCISSNHEARWLNLLGFSLRPGFGVVGDEDRIRRLWKLWHQGTVSHATDTEANWWILWRRISGGLSSGQQNQLAGIIGKSLITKDNRTVIKKDDIVVLETWCALASLEKIPPQQKLKFLNVLLNGTGRLDNRAFWPIARIAARKLFSGTDDAVIPAAKLEPLIPTLLQKARQSNCPPLAMLACANAVRITGLRIADVSDTVRNVVRDYLTQSNAPATLTAMIDSVCGSEPMQAELLGDALPLGLTLA